MSGPGPVLTMSRDFLPYQDFGEAVEVVEDGDTTLFENSQVRLIRTKASLSYPIVLAQGKTILANELSYQYLEFRFRNFIENPLKVLHSANYTLMVQQKLSQKWSAWTLGIVSMASDLESEVSSEDFGLQAAVIFIRHFSERFSLGLGAAYSAQFGDAGPVPILALDWNNGSNMMARAILPANLEFWYSAGPRLDLGLKASGDGNNFHGDPDSYVVKKPRLRYTMLTVAPAARIRITSRLGLNIEGGIVGLHRFEFYDYDEESASYDLKPNYFIRTGLEFGI